MLIIAFESDKNWNINEEKSRAHLQPYLMEGRGRGGEGRAIEKGWVLYILTSGMKAGAGLVGSCSQGLSTQYSLRLLHLAQVWIVVPEIAALWISTEGPVYKETHPFNKRLVSTTALALLLLLITTVTITNK